jgi:photosystem II stability/assembly factor-like uncharacterized protein
MNWQLVGPTYAPGATYHDYYTGNTLASSGRVNSLAVVASTCHTGGCDTIYLGTANGGLWKTTNGGETWATVFSTVVNSAIGALAVDPANPNIVYVGTGEANFAIDSNRGTGIYRTTDGGAHWSPLGGYSDFVNRAITGLIVDPRTAGTTNTSLYVTTASGSTGSSAIAGGSGSAPFLPNRGFYYSTDGGKTWTHNNPTAAEITGTGAYTPTPVNMPAHSLVMDPNDPSVLYAGFTSTGLFKSVDDGRTWAELKTGLPPATTFTIGRYTLAMAPDESNVLYVAYNSPTVPASNGAEKIFKSTNLNTAAPTFTQLVNAPQACDGQCWYDMPLTVAPGDSAVYAGGSATYNGYTFDGYVGPCSTFYPYSTNPACNDSIMKSTDGGASWRDISANDQAGGAPYTGGGPLHPDNHVILVNPADANNVYTGNDGGLSVTQNATDNDPTWKDLNKGLSTLQFQGLAVGPTGSIFGGTQDNGTFRLDPGSNGVSAHSFTGDGGQPMADPSDPNIAYYATTGTSLLRDDNVYCTGCDPVTKLYQDFGSTITQVNDFGADAAQFYAPHVIDTAQPATIFEGTYRILRSFNRGGTNGNPGSGPGHDSSSNDDPSDSTGGASTDGSIPGNWAPLSNSSTFGPAGSYAIAAIATSPLDPNVLAVATTTGRIYYTDNALANVTVDTPANCDGRTSAHHRVNCVYQSGINWRRIDGIVFNSPPPPTPPSDVGTTPNRFPSSLSFVPGSTTKVLVSFSGFNETTPGVPGHVFQGTIGAATTTWKRIDGSGFTALPNLPFSSVVANPNKPGHLYAAGDIGVFFSPDNGAHWLRADYGLPNTPIYQLVFDSTNNTLLAATHGRAIWRASAP